MYNIKNTWTYRNIQLIIIAGLVVGIAIQSLGLNQLTIKGNMSNTEVYVKAQTQDNVVCIDGDDDCIIEQLLEHYTQKQFEDNLEFYWEDARMNAFEDVNLALVARMDDSPYVDYEALKARYGY